MLKDNPGIQGGPQFLQWLTEDGFLTYGQKIPPTARGPFVLGQGSGTTQWEDIGKSLLHFNTKGHGYLVRRAVTNAIAWNPTDDGPVSRAKVLAWVDQIAAQGNNTRFQDLSKFLVETDWTTGEYHPPTSHVPFLFRLTYEERHGKTIVDFPKWVKDASVISVLDQIDPLVYPKDPLFESRELISLQVQTAAARKLPGYAALDTALTQVGWDKSPFAPVPLGGVGANITIQLGGLSDVDLDTELSTKGRTNAKLVTSVANLVRTSLNTYDPSLGERVLALNSLKKAMTQPWADHFTGYKELTAALETAGFVDVPRGKRPVPGGAATDFFVRGIVEERPVWAAQPTGFATLQDFVNNCKAIDVERIASAASDIPGSPAFIRWVIIQTVLNKNLWGIPAATKALQFYDPVRSTAVSTALEMVKRGYLMSTPQQVPPFSKDEQYWNITFGSHSAPVIFDPWQLFQPNTPGGTPTGPRITGPDVIYRAIWMMYSNAGQGAGADGMLPATQAEAKKGMPVIGIPGATFEDLKAQVIRPPSIDTPIN